MKQILSFLGMFLFCISQLNGKDLNKDNVQHVLGGAVQERVYLHFDNTSYNKGEHIWFKAYVVRGDNLRQTDMSRYLYVELFNAIGCPVETQRLKIENGQAHGSILLSDTLRPGFYEVRAYTRWMLNFTPGDGHAWKKFDKSVYKRTYGQRFQHFLKGNAGMFSRVFAVYDISSGARSIGRVAEKANDADKLNVDFYPEGGNIIEGVPCRVAFQARTKEGRYVDLEGSVWCGGRQVAVAKSLHEGRGVITLDAATTATGKALVLKVANGSGEFVLPKIKNRGMAMGVSDAGAIYNICVSRTRATNTGRCKLLVSCRQKVLALETVDFGNALSVNKTIDKTVLTTGVNVATLFSEKGKVLAQREFFVDNGDRSPLSVDVNIPEQTLRPYAKVTLDCNIDGVRNIDTAVPATLSVAVRDAEATERTSYSDNMLTYMLLSSEIKGYVNDAGYYFLKADHSRKAALDHLLMVQGWTRYDFESVEDGKVAEPEFEVEKSNSFAGQFYNTTGNWQCSMWTKLKKHAKVYCKVATDSGKDFYMESKMTDGRFTLPLEDFAGKGQIYLALNDFRGNYDSREKLRVAINKLRDTAIKPLNGFSPLPKPYGYYECVVADGVRKDTDTVLQCSAKMTKGLAEAFVANAYGRLGSFFYPMLGERDFLEMMGIDGRMTVTDGFKSDITDAEADSIVRNRYWNENLYQSSQMAFCTTLSLYSAPSIRPMHSAPRYGELVSGRDLLDRELQHIRRIDNKVPVTAHLYCFTDQRSNIYVSKWEKEKKGMFAFEERQSRADLMEYITETGHSALDYISFTAEIQGITEPSEFYSPDYSKMPLPDNGDHRRTLYWNPDVTTDSDGHARLEFYNNSTCRQISVSAEGMTSDGRAITYR